MLQVDQVYKTYVLGKRRVQALRGIDLSLPEPGFFAIMGASGSGKSTLLHLLAGLDQPDQGSIRVAQEDLAQLKPGALTVFRRRKIGVVFQQFNLIPTLTARQNIALPGLIDRKPRSWINARVDELMNELGLQDRADHKPEALSGGEQQRVAIARALLFEPPILLADEPTGALDSASSDRLWRLLAELAGRHQTVVLMVTHEPAAAAHCRWVYVLSDGEVLGDFEVEQLDASGVATRYQQLGQPARS